MLEHNLKYLRLIDPSNLHEIEAINVGSTSLITAFFLKAKDMLVISSNDKYLNFYDIDTHKL